MVGTLNLFIKQRTDINFYHHQNLQKDLNWTSRRSDTIEQDWLSNPLPSSANTEPRQVQNWKLKENESRIKTGIHAHWATGGDLHHWHFSPSIWIFWRRANPPARRLSGGRSALCYPRSVGGAHPNKSEQLILHCCSFWFLFTENCIFEDDELSSWCVNACELKWKNRKSLDGDSTPPASTTFSSK